MERPLSSSSPKKPCAATTSLAAIRGVVGGLFAAGKSKPAARLRQEICLHATECGLICERLVKGYGKAQVHCVDPDTGKAVATLYEALENPEFTCPIGLF
jgi:hypothetical protein